MKKIAGVLMALPMLAFGANDVPSDPATARACYSALADNSSKDELMTAISCLRNNPFAGTAVVNDFAEKRRALLSRYQQAPDAADLNQALNQMRTQKTRRIYVEYQSPRNGSGLLVVDSATMLVYPRPHDPQSVTVYDLSALKLRFAEESGIFSADKTVPLANVRGFQYQESPGGQRIGKLVTLHTDGTHTVQNSYQGAYPVRAYDSKDKSFNDIAALWGTLYTDTGRVDNANFALDQVGLSTYSVTFISEEGVKAYIARAEQAGQARERAAAQARDAEAKQASAQAQVRADNLAQMAKAKIGTEDSCPRTDLGKYVVVKDPTRQDVEVNCQFSGLTTLFSLKKAGWLVVNKQWRDDVVTEYLIRKAR